MRNVATLIENLFSQKSFIKNLQTDFDNLIQPHKSAQKILIRRTRNQSFNVVGEQLHKNYQDILTEIINRKKANEITLSDITKTNFEFICETQGSILPTNPFTEGGYEIDRIPAQLEYKTEKNLFSNRVQWFAQKIRDNYHGLRGEEKKCKIILSILGNNSREATVSQTELFKEIVAQECRAIEEKTYEITQSQSLLADIHFMVTSSAGKATDVNVVEGLCINIPDSHEILQTTQSGKLSLTQNSEFIFDEIDYDLKQFGCNSIRVKISHNTATVYNNETSEIILKNINIKLIGHNKHPALLFGKSESSRNRHELRCFFSAFISTITNKEIAATILEATRTENFILFEEKTTNTGANVQAGYKLVRSLCNATDVPIENTILIHSQKMQQSVRALGTGVIQFNGTDNPEELNKPTFYLAGYLNGLFKKDIIPYLNKKQLMMWYLCLLKEFIAEQYYLVTDKRYHLPTAYQAQSFDCYCKHVIDLFNYLSPSDKMLFTSDNLNLAALNKWFNHNIWPAIESELAPGPATPQPKTLMLANAMYPFFARKLDIPTYEEDRSASLRDAIYRRITL